MIEYFEICLRKLKHILSPTAWTIKFLKLSTSKEFTHRPGLILIQIDGVSRTHFHRALDGGYLPFIKSLLRQEELHEWPFYSGLPSSTPSVQGELFYGVKQGVSAFKFKDHETGRIFTMYNPGSAAKLEERLKEEGEPLLKGGSSYGNIFAGGAEESHFCVATGWETLKHLANPFRVLVISIFHLVTVLRIFFFSCLEIVFALANFIRGFLNGYSLWGVVRLHLNRILFAVFLREYITERVRMDIIRGLPIIHLNYLAYDEQAHLRGPDSGWAYLSLKAVDRCVRKIWNEAHHSMVRDYDVWIYSDHGQELVTPYSIKEGRSIQKAVEEVYSEVVPENPDEKEKVLVTARGPVGHIYLPSDLNPEMTELLATQFVAQAKIPLVLTLTKEDRVRAWTPEGAFSIPEEAHKILGENHPFLKVVTQELVHLCHHADKGTFLIMGWRKDERSISFPMEWGSHAGPGSEETHAFALLPVDCPVSPESRSYLRALDLRDASLKLLGRGKEEKLYLKKKRELPHDHLRVMSYNIHRCRGMDGSVSPERIARVIARYNPDVIALQEVARGFLPSDDLKQAERIAELLDMEHHFHVVHRVERHEQGNAILSRFPIKLMKASKLPGHSFRSFFEPRGALWVELDLGEKKVQMMNVHLSLWPHERRMQANALLSEEWLSHESCKEPVILCGDFNSLPHSPVYRKITQKLKDAQYTVNSRKHMSTWFGRYPLGCIDYIFVDGLKVKGVKVPRTKLEKNASDHLPLIADLML